MEQTEEATAELGDLEAMVGGLCGLVPGPATTAGTLVTPPPKKIHRAVNGVSGALRGCPQEQRALLG